MNSNLRDYTWVFVGCGGTFYAASPYLSVLAKRYCRSRVIFIDPDTLEEGDAGRQWPWYSPGVTKAVTGAIAVMGDNDHAADGVSVYEIVNRFRADDLVLERETDGRPVLAIVNVDNDEARLNVAAWLVSRVSPGIMIVSGCESDFGQCYPGVWNEGEAILDWRTLHPDVGDTSAPPTNPCNIQTIKSNALTGTLVGMCIEDVAFWLAEGGRECLSEFYWDIDPETNRVKMWETLVKTGREVPSC